MRLGSVMGASLLALLTLCPMSRAAEAKATGPAGNLGITVAALDYGMRERLGYRSGVLVTEVAAGGMAEHAGVQDGDVLVVVGDVTMRKVSDLARAESAIVPGEPVSIVFSRNSGRLIKMVKVEPPPVPPAAAFGSEPAALETAAPTTDDDAKAAELAAAGTIAASASGAVAEPQAAATEEQKVLSDTEDTDLPVLSEAVPVVQTPATQAATVDVGLRCENVDATLAAKRGVEADQGAVVREVVANSAAAQAGIRAGDVIVGIGDQQIWGVDHLGKVVSHTAFPMVVSLNREGADEPIKVRLAAPVVPEPAAPPAQGDEVKALRDEVKTLRQELQTLKDALLKKP